MVHCVETAKPAACAKPLMLSTAGREGEIYVKMKGGRVRQGLHNVRVRVRQSIVAFTGVASWR